MYSADSEGGERARGEMESDDPTEGTYERFEKKAIGANLHFIRFSNDAEPQPIKLKDLQPTQWEVLPPLALPIITVELDVMPMTGSAFVLADVSLGWTVLQLKEAICAQPEQQEGGATPELLRLIVQDTPLDDETALLSACGVSAE